MTAPATVTDLERIAALVEGRLAGAERDTVMASVEADEGLREVLADLVRFRAADAAAISPPHSASYRRPWRLVLPLAAAAAIAAVLLLPRRDGWTRPLAVDRLTPAIGSPTLSLPTGWYEHAWDVPRGGGDSSTYPGDASFRLGVRLQDLAAAVAAGHRADGASVGKGLEVLVARQPGMQPEAVEVAAAVRDFVSGAADATTLVPRLAAVDFRIAENRNVDSTAFALGKWAAAGRLAAMAGGSHTIPAAPPALLEQAERLSRSDAERARAFATLRDALANENRGASAAALAKAFAGWIDRF